jgi:hypothetical protein
MEAALIHLEPKQKRGLERRARQRKTSLSSEVRSAVDLYLELPPDVEKELSFLAQAASQAADRMIRDLERTIATVDKALKRMEKVR